MSITSVRKQVVEKNVRVFKEKNNAHNNSFFKNLKKVYPLGIHRSNSLLSVSSLSLSQTSTDESLTDNSCSLDQKITQSIESIRVVVTSPEKIRVSSPVMVAKNDVQRGSIEGCGHEVVKRCHWITKSSDKVYVSYHDEQWGVPVYDDNQLFELLSMSGMLMDYNWTEILKRRNLLRDAFGGFDVNLVAQMGEKEILEISLNKELGLAECRARCIVDNAKGIIKVMKEFGSFSSYIWGYFNFKPIINKYKFSRNVPLRTPKAETISKDLIRRGFRLVGPVILQSFTQAAGMTIDHLIDCFRYNECVSLAENPWRHM
ncbi:hypothetical protein RND81_07G173200 [Saponaria officinalis]|uniref:DNA-3-methyladenine glycosylase I n=1 Tax=Saponaria officinalis TaxID=3572 RepID=A0AAW1JRC4_SAPOF